jgi:uncharacterized protein involved in exopolysaccharide biosynthesis
MTGDQMVTDPGAEREIDLRKWVDALVSRWWIAVIGLVIGVVIGAIYSLSGGSTYTATALIARGQAFSPGGTSSVLTYLTSPAAIQAYATSTEDLKYAAAKAGMSVGELRGHVTTSTVGTVGQTAAQNTNSILVQISVALNRPKRAENAANALAQLIQRQTTSKYVTQSIASYQQRLANYAVRIKTLQAKINVLNATIAHPQGLTPIEQLVPVDELDTAEATLGQTLDSQQTIQQLLTLAQEVEQTQVVQFARAQKSTARSRRNSVIFGGLIGLLIGLIVALVVGLRAASRPATV